MAVAMLLINAKGGNKNKGAKNNVTDNTPSTKQPKPKDTDTPNHKKTDPYTNIKPKNTNFDSPKKQKQNGEAFADAGDKTIKKPEFEEVTLSDGTKVKRLKPNIEYEVNGYTYKTDGQGRIMEVNGTLKDISEKRNNYAQRTVGKNDGRLDTDQGGHLIGKQFGGAGGKENLVSMDKDVNNYHKGEWGQMEKNWAKNVKEGKQVDVKVEPIYTDNTARPSSFKITEIIDGVINERTIIN